MTQDDRRKDSNRWLDQQYDRSQEERRRAERTRSDYKAILERNPSQLRETPGWTRPGRTGVRRREICSMLFSLRIAGSFCGTGLMSYGSGGSSG